MNPTDLAAVIADLGQRARTAARLMASAATAPKDRALRAAAAAIRREAAALKAANALDLQAAREAGHDAAFVDRLALTDAVIAGMAEGLEQIAALADPVGEISEVKARPSGIQVGPHAGSAWCDWHHLRVATQCHHRCGRSVHQIGQCHGASRRV